MIKSHLTSEKSSYEYFSVFFRAFRRYFRISIGPSLVLLGLSLVLVAKLPDYYTSDSQIHIQSQQVSSKVVNPPDKQEMRERLEALVQEILSRPRLNAIRERFGLYPHLIGVIGKERAVQKLKDEIQIHPVSSPSSGASLLQTFRLSFSHRDPKISYEVTKAVSNLFIEESLVDQRSEVQGTEEFIDSQLTEARAKLEETENRVQEFIRNNSGKLPEHQDAAFARLTSLQSQLDTNRELISANSIRRENLKRELDDLARDRSYLVAEQGSGQSSDPAESLAKLEAALIVLSSRYSEKHPDVINTRRRIEALRQQLSLEDNGKNSRATLPSPNSDGIRTIRREIGEVDIAIKTLSEENDRLKPEVARLRSDIEQMPIREQELIKIRRDYDNVKQNYERLLTEKQNVGLQASLIRSQKATQFRIIEPAELPALPAGPNRLVIFIGSLVGSLAVLLLLPQLLFLVNRSFKETHEVEAELGLAVLGAIPPMPTPEAVALTQRVALLSIVTSLISMISGSILIYWIV